MKIHEILDRDPRSLGLANDGQARIVNEYDDNALLELKAELEEATDAYHSAPWASHFRTEEDGGVALYAGT